MTHSRTLTLKSLDIPSINRFSVGFADGIFNELLKLSEQSNTNYPPYNIIKETDDKFRIEVATAGFSEGEITVSVENQMLMLVGKKSLDESGIELEYLYRGISGRCFERVFRLGDHVEVIDAQNKNGILTIYIERKLPEALLPKKIDIQYFK